MKPRQNCSILDDRSIMGPESTAENDDLDYRAFFNRSPVPAFVFRNINGAVVLADYNLAAAECLGGVAPDVLNLPADRIFRDFKGAAAWLTDGFSAQDAEAGKMYYQEEDNAVYPNLRFILTYLDVDKRMVHLENLHKQRQAEADLSESKERLELAIYATDSGLWDWHVPSGEVIFGEQWAAILGYTIDEIEPHISTWLRLLHPEDKPRVMENLERHLAGELPRYESEHRLMGKNGEWVWVLDVGKVVEWDAQNSPVRMAGTKVDISSRKKMETELEQLNSQLERRIEERTRKLKESEQSLLRSQERLRNESRHLQEANSALKILLKKSAENKQEIEENILANLKELVLPYLSKIEEKGLNETQMVYMDIIHSNFDEITSNFSRRLTTLHLNLTPAEVSVAKLIKQGKSTKEIADLLFLSSKTIETQRSSIRRKLGLQGKKINLKTYLDGLIK